ncbi:hypothetical protein N7488_001252 [Penicillium malachiteum]|nr:hypothetical protein N7488_001252 [Penicillium malachiteum]
MDENLLAAAVVLRFYEELDSPFIDIPTDVATRGLHVFIEAQASLALSSKGLRNRWLERRPPALFPVYSEPPEREQGFIFPQKWFLNDCHIVAEQTLGLLEILLTAYDPSVARIGPGQRIAMESTDARLKCTVLDICGTALSNRQEPTALLTACIAIGICGDRFTGLAEQKALMDIVINSVRDNNYWPSNALAEKLRKAWGWAD